MIRILKLVCICLHTARTNKLVVTRNEFEHMHMNEMSATNLFSRQAQALNPYGEPWIWSEGWGLKNMPAACSGGLLTFIDLQDCIIECLAQEIIL